ncbi:penicillin-binding transpeptidase domain-containing protein [Alkalibacter mobilis]|uniref:penicillin-binding transpeptidase domain-containing protein n=1 Tax=Alkalibacter mobilis TaxID=2787712 RepID=UPI00189F8F71|nr:penicillin-binding transpeptidase domain-containing protein [Alkalibacter mobilis]MBF7096578.1 hypothetical protein [Alkalibacter mobilis]
MIVNEKKIRFPFIYGVLLLVMTLFLFRLAQLQIVEGDYYSKVADNKMLQKISESAPRGNILTDDGYVVAKNRIGYSVNLTYASMDEEVRNNVFLTLFDILESNEEKFADEFPIVIEEGRFVFTYEIDEKNWKIENDIPVDANAHETLQVLRERYNVKAEVNDTVALEAIEKVHLDKSLPIINQDEDLIFRFSSQEKSWKKSYGFKEEEYDFTAAESFEKLRSSFGIDESYTNEDARKIMVFRQMLKNQGFRSWEPVEITRDIDLKTVLQIDENIHNLPGVSVTAKPIRDYPYANLASHVIGYIGKVGEADVENGYKLNDMKGISGIEYSYEEYLKGEDGISLAITDYLGRPQNSGIEESIDPIPGSDVITTIDYDLQKTAEAALVDQIKAIRENNRAPQASSGAVVAIDVKTGGVLALASYPDYDPNLFATGISTEDWQKLNIMVDDPLYPKPLYNNATLTALQPGSTFKPMMAIAGLEEGKITTTSTIYCRGVHPIFTQFSCLSVHGSENVVEAIRDSCNVYFYETGYRLGVDKIEYYAASFGLGKKTGLEIAESSGYLATKADKKQIWTYSTSDYIRNTIGIEGTATIINSEGNEQLVYKSYAIAKELFEEVDEEYSSYGDVYRKSAEVLEKYNIKETKYLHRITEYLLAGRWVVSDTINASIGQGGNSFTPIQLANYIATLVNGGNRMETYLVDSVVDNSGEIVYEKTPKVLETIEINDKNLDAVKQGMKLVTTNGTARSAFAGFDHSGIGVGGKTGTAQYGSKTVDNTAWFVGFAPYEEPEIAIVVLIIQGKTSSNTVPVARKVLDTYFYDNMTYEERLEKEALEKLEEDNELSEEQIDEQIDEQMEGESLVD